MLTKFCKNKKTQKTLAIVLIITMTLANLLLLGKNLISYAIEENLEMQGTSTQHNNVKFDAYFNNDRGDKTHSVVFDVQKDSAKINLNISVKEAGYLKEAYVDFRDESNGTNTNYEISSDSENATLIQSINTNMKTITLNYVESGTDAVIELPIKLNLTELMEIKKLSQNTSVTLRGIYVDRNGNEVQINKTIKLNLGWTLDTQLNLQQIITKYVPYTNNEKTGLILQILVKAGQNNDSLVLPVESTEIKIKVPEIAGTLPEKVTVIADNTLATNGNKVEFTSEDWKYEDGIITINTKGYNQDGLVWAGAGEDNYFVTYIYSNDVYNYVLENELVLNCEAEAKMDVYTPEGIVAKTATSNGDVTLSEKVGEIVTYNIEANQKEMSKGKMYANYNSETKTYDTEYATTIKLNVSNSDIVEELYLQLPEDNFKIQEGTYSVYSNYKRIMINKAKVENLLGQDGYINISDGVNTYAIDKDTEDTDGVYVINFENAVQELTVKTSKPVSDGILEIDTVKSISKDLTYSKDQVKEFDSIKVNLIGNTKYAGNKSYVSAKAEDTIALTETSTKAIFEISNTEFSTMVENKNVEMKIVLNNNVETSDLYKNAIFTIKLPKYIEDIEITGGNILYTSGLEIDHVEKNYTDNGIVLKVVTKGAETKFSDGVFTNGANIVLNTNIKVNEQTPNISDKIVFEYENESATSYADNGSETEVKFEAPEEMVTMNTISLNGVETTSINNEEQTAKLEILESSKVATMTISILNKYANICNNIRILGRTPFAGNKEITTGKDLGTTFDAQLISGINTNGTNAIVYYSANENATEDLQDPANAWTTDLASVDSVKSYLIVLPNYEMKVGEKLEFTYNVRIPDSLEHNESAYATYVVYFNSVSNYTVVNQKEARKVGASTGIGANMEMTTTSIVNNEMATTVKEYQSITYKTTVTNTGSVDAENVKIVTNITNGTITNVKGSTLTDFTDSNVTKFTQNVVRIPAGESYTLEYTVTANELKNEGDKVTNNVTVTADNFESELTDTLETNIENADIKVSLSTLDLVHTNDSEIYFNIFIQNISDKAINNMVVTEYIPEGLIFVEKSDSDIKYDESTRMISINIGTLEAENDILKTIYLKTNLPAEIGEIVTNNVVNVTGDDIDTYSSYITVVIQGPVLKLDLTSTTANGSYIKEGDTIDITAVAQNTGAITASSSNIRIELPKQLKVNSAYYYDENQNKEVNLKKITKSIYSATLDIENGEKVTININATVLPYEEDEEETNVEIIATMDANRTEKVTSNTLRYIIEKDDSYDSDNPYEQTPSVKTYKITGVSWLDENEDGQKNDTEPLLEGINVLLINAKTGVIVTDMYNGTIKEVETSDKGEYTFSNIPAGDYMVVFEYDSAYYDITEYNKVGVPENLTSKAIQTKINKDGVLQTAGVTDTISITDSSIANINIGLIEKPKFDLSLEKQLYSTTISNNAGTKTYTFDNKKLGKIDIPAKNLNSTLATIEYKLIIKNNGAIPGTAKKIVDYISNDLSFDETNNPGWYMGTDGNLYNDTLANIIINPGETKELKLVLTKKMTEENTGIITNKAEIYEDYNEFGYEDYNSQVANKAQGENDLDYANLIITVKTGQVAIYITITLISIAIVAIGIYEINKRVLKGGNI